jgi:hypothetical protein
MNTEDLLAKEFTRIIKEYYPAIGELLDGCYVKIITSYWGRPPRRLRYVGIYCTMDIMPYIKARKDVFRDIADNMGLMQVVFLNATRLLRDPKSTLKDSDPRLWLELHLIAA